MAKNAPHLLVIGPGYSAGYIIQWFLSHNHRVSVVARREDVRAHFEARGIKAHSFEESDTWPADTTHLLSSVAPPRSGSDGLPDPILLDHSAKLDALTSLTWIGYLSSTNVYGDQGGATVNEFSPAAPTQDRGVRRLAAEDAWRSYGEKRALTVHVFRLAGIYGPGRNALETVKSGRARRIIKEGQVFSRIHVADIANLVGTAALSGLPTGVFNGADKEPAPPQDVITYAAELLGVTPPPEIPFEQADLSPMAKSFYAESKKVVSARLSELGITHHYSTYRTGLSALLAEKV